LIVRRVKRLQPLASDGTEQGELFAAYRHHAFITNSTLDLVQADQRHRDHAIVEQVIAELKDGPLAHLPDVILSRPRGQVADLRVCVMDVFSTQPVGCLGSARSDEFCALALGRVAAWGRSGDAGGACRAEGLGERLAQLAVVFLELADPLCGCFQAAQQRFVGGALSLRGRWRSGRRLVSAAECLDLGS
jgi:hypothetical protein